MMMVVGKKARRENSLSLPASLIFLSAPGVGNLKRGNVSLKRALASNLRDRTITWQLGLAPRPPGHDR